MMTTAGSIIRRILPYASIILLGIAARPSWAQDASGGGSIQAKNPPTTAAGAEAAEQGPAHPDTCRIGIYILSLYDFDCPNNAFTSDFWMWFTYGRDSLDPLKSAEVTNAKSYTYSNSSTEKKKGLMWGAQKCKATVRETWDIRDFPFDHQVLRIEIEDADKDTSELIYLPDVAQSKIDPRVTLDGWKISGMRFVRHDARYNTNYGDPELAASSTYPGVVAIVELQREGVALFFKLFTGVYVAFAISMMVFFFDETEIGTRFSLLVGAMFAAVANKYIVDSFLPMSVGFTLVDGIHVMTFVYILLSGCISVFVMHYQRKTGAQHEHGALVARRIDRHAFITLLLSYIGINAFYLVRAS
ncbi:MAG TPA: hypothetical protein VHI13_01760 [Candidatus Kapabacteria bacterium]|nr:hypothetical protein [Candidatus Kapabacteria bacterium]